MKFHLLVATTVLVLTARVAVAQEAPAPAGHGKTGTTEDRIGELERKVEEQGRELEDLKREEAREKAHEPAEKGHGEKPGEKAEGPHTEYDQGFQIRGELGGSEYLVRPVGGIELDYHAFPHAKPKDRFVLQRAIVGLVGKVNVFDYDFEVCPTRGQGGGIPLDNFFFQVHAIDELMARVGHYRTPFTIDSGVLNPYYVDLAGAPMCIDSLAPDLHPGAELLGHMAGHLFQYWLSVQNQTDSNKVVSGDPMTSARVQVEHLGFSLGCAGVWENLSTRQESVEGATPGGFRWFDPVDVRGWTQRYEVDLFYEHGPFFAGGEYLYVSQERWRVLADGGNGTGLVAQGFYATAGFMFWGPSEEGESHHAEHAEHAEHGEGGREKHESAHPLPRPPFEGWKFFDMGIERRGNKRNVGMELVARVEWMSVGDSHGGRKGQGGVPATPSTAPDADKVASNEARAFSIGINLDPIENVRFMADWVHLRIGDQSRAERDHSRFADEFLFRAQLEF